MKYIKLIEKWFPNQEYYIQFNRRGHEYIVTIRVNDYVLNRSFHKSKLDDYSGDPEKLMDEEIEYMFEAIKGKLEDIKEKRWLP